MISRHSFSLLLLALRGSLVGAGTADPIELPPEISRRSQARVTAVSRLLVDLSTTKEEKFTWIANRFRIPKPRRARFFELTSDWRNDRVHRLTDAERRAREDRIRIEFGPEIVAAIERLEQTHEFQPIVDALALDSFRTDKPLEVAQAMQLFDDIYAVAKDSAGNFQAESLNFHQLAERAGAYLNERQLAALKLWRMTRELADAEKR